MKTHLLPGDRVDRYRIVRHIGSGGMGDVYQASHEFTHKPVALKLLNVAHAGKPQLVEKMRAEAMVLCRIEHDNLVSVYDAGISDEGIWMAMDLLDGESLGERLRREGPVSPPIALDWAARVADGLQAAHAAGVIHRDLKPDNVFITKQGSIKVLDFGTAKFTNDPLGPAKKTEPHARMGTPAYMSPEQLCGEPIDERSDVFSLGLVLYQMLAGRHPFALADGRLPPLDQLLPMMLAGEPPTLAEPLGESVWQVVARACGHDRARRYASMAELAAALRRVRHALLGPALTPPPTPMLSQMTPLPMGVSGVQPAPRGVTLQQLVAMALVAALFGALVVVLSFGGDRDAETLEIIDVAAPSPTETSQGPAAPELSAPEPAAPEPPPAASTSASARAAASGAPSAAPRVPPPARRGPRQPCREIVCP